LLGSTGEEEDTADEITAAHHGGSSSKTAKSDEGTDGSAKAPKESKSVSIVFRFRFLLLA
jgi:hypothetical protein